MPWHRHIALEALFEADQAAPGSRMGPARLARRSWEPSDAEELARAFIRAVGKPRFGGFVVREVSVTSLRPGIKMLREMVRAEVARTGPRSSAKKPGRSRTRRPTRA
ncbi:MAG TPA: hypothetical protein VGR87_12955 [Candidatus Limnocylindria bacterium]|jgi:hypothetical protein|nr:hypothetical protein [Candidatus Limnocylindria bacterium]